MLVYKVGGAVRDELLGLPVQDVDWVVVGSTPAQMQELGYRPVGGDFPVFLHPHTGEEYALARTERKNGHGYGGFVFHAEPTVTLEQDLLRRDLTINAMAMDDQGQLVDPYGGASDLDNKVLRHVSPAFAEDPLRVLRVARFAARYAHMGFTIADETLELMQQLAHSGELAHLVAERVWQECARALMEPSPDVFIQVLHETDALKPLLPEVDRLFGVPQRAEFHPEVDTGVHVLMVLQQCARFEQNLGVRWACLLHDLGKGITPEHILPRHLGHETRGVPLIKEVCLRLRVPRDLTELALLVGEYHLHSHRALELKPSTLLKLLLRLDCLRRPARLEDFINACEMDARGRLGFTEREYPPADFLREAAECIRRVDVQLLLERGLKGAELGEALYQARLGALKGYCAR
mgnify:FL=1